MFPKYFRVKRELPSREEKCLLCDVISPTKLLGMGQWGAEGRCSLYWAVCSVSTEGQHNHTHGFQKLLSTSVHQASHSSHQILSAI